MLPHFTILEKIKEAAEGLSRRIAGTLRERLPDTGYETADPWWNWETDSPTQNEDCVYNRVLN